MKHFLATLVLSTTLLTSFARANDETRICSNIVKRQLPMKVGKKQENFIKRS